MILVISSKKLVVRAILQQVIVPLFCFKIIQYAMLVFALQKTTTKLCCSICIQHGKFHTQLQGCHVEVNPSPRCCKTLYCLQVQYSICASKFSKGLNILAAIGSPIYLCTNTSSNLGDTWLSHLLSMLKTCWTIQTTVDIYAKQKNVSVRHVVY